MLALYCSIIKNLGDHGTFSVYETCFIYFGLIVSISLPDSQAKFLSAIKKLH